VIRRRLLKVAVPLSLAVVAAACGGSSGGSNGGGGGNKPSYTIGFQGPLSGGNQALGINEQRGMHLAIKQANAKGDLPFTLAFLDADDQGTGKGSPSAARKLIDGKVVAVVGPSFSGASNAAGPLFKQAGLLAVTPSATLPDVTKHGFTTFYRGVANDFAQGPPDAKYLANVVKAKKIFVIDDTSDYGKGLADAFKGELNTSGKSSLMVGSDSGPQTAQCAPGSTGNTAQYPTLATKVASKNADAVFYGGYYCDLALLAKALRNNGFKGTIMSGDGSKDQLYITQAGAAVAEGSYISCQCTEITKTTGAEQFVADYKADSGADPGAYSAEAFDVTNSIISIMKGIGKDVTKASLLAAYPNVDFKGLTKSYKFGPDHELATQAAFLYKVEAAKLVFLGDLADLTK
jgi:branched-chain amino acid transport system substrate-binding protein